MIDCVLTAGGVPQPDDPLFPLAQGKPKTLIEIAGKPIAQWVVDALTETPQVREIVVVGLAAETRLLSPKIVHHHPDQGSLLGNGLAGITWLLEHNPAEQVLTCSADIPLLTAEMVSWLILQHHQQPVDLTYTVIPRPVMEAAFPASGRTYTSFVEMEVAGGDVHVVNPHIFITNRALWHDLADSRKEALKAAMRLGPGIFVRLLLHRLSLSDLEKRIERQFGLRVRTLPSPYPEMGMDVDKPHQLEICRRVLEGAA
ncbi:MAG: molybdenum cofactor guanylyltransferase [Anaerolineae bacterium]